MREKTKQDVESLLRENVEKIVRDFNLEDNSRSTLIVALGNGKFGAVVLNGKISDIAKNLNEVITSDPKFRDIIAMAFSGYLCLKATKEEREEFRKLFSEDSVKEFRKKSTTKISDLPIGEN